MGYREEFTELLGVDLVAKVKALALKFSTETVVEAPKEAPTAEVKLEDVILKDGTVLQVEKMEVGAMANIVTPEGVMPATDGEYVAENGTVITVMGGLIAEIATAEEEAPEAEVAPVVAGINSQLEAVTKRLADIEAKFESQTIELNETKKGLGVALSSVEKLTKQPVAISLEKQKPSSKRIEDMTELEKFRAYKSK